MPRLQKSDAQQAETATAVTQGQLLHYLYTHGVLDSESIAASNKGNTITFPIQTYYKLLLKFFP